MKAFLVFVAGVAVGIAGSFLFAPALMGAGAGAGIATGLKAGACLTVEAAKERGVMTPQQINEVLATAGKLIASSSGSADGPALSGGEAECAQVVAELRKAAQKK
jgi:hypothetical protein